MVFILIDSLAILPEPSPVRPMTTVIPPRIRPGKKPGYRRNIAML
jgi:hypothetical protein